MKVTQVGILPTDASVQAGRPALTPELLAASGARYSRNNEGLDAILDKIDPENLDKSVDSIFKMVDYGHQSIADMVPVAIFIDEISIWLAYYVWTLCPMAGGQESSTRYIKLSREGLIDPEEAGIAVSDIPAWESQMAQCFDAYQLAVQFWEEVAAEDPSLMRLPASLLNDTSEKAKRQVARMQRNYAFDRARYFLPVAATTNMMLVMSARNWIQLCQSLLSHTLPEPRRLGGHIKTELNLAAPRLTKHAEAKPSFEAGLRREFDALVRQASDESAPHLSISADSTEAEPTAKLSIFAPQDLHIDNLADDLSFHDNRYAYIGEGLRRTAVRFSWDAVAMAEIRDLNRHRTGTKYCPLIPKGFYHAMEQLPDRLRTAVRLDALQEMGTIGQRFSRVSHNRLASAEPSYVYWTVLGSQYSFEHITMMDKFVYEAELRNGTGAHFRYAKHLRDAMDVLVRQSGKFADGVTLGLTEPE